MENTINQAFSEVYDILMRLEKGLYDKIPKEFITAIEKNRDMEYKVNIDYSKDINEQELLMETRIILSLIYRDYLCDEEKRKQLLEEDERQLKENEKNLREKYNPDKLFQNNKKEKIVDNANENKELTIVEEEKWYKKIIIFIKSIFKINR